MIWNGGKNNNGIIKKKDQKMFKNDELVVRAVSLHPKQLENGFLFPLQFIKNLGW